MSLADNMNREELHFEPDPVIEAYKRNVDRTLIRENLRLSVEQRFEQLMRLQQFAEELRQTTTDIHPDTKNPGSISNISFRISSRLEVVINYDRKKK